MLINNTLQGNRERIAFTQAEIGKLFDLSDDAIGNYENGRRAPGLAIALGLELLFGRTLAELYPRLACATAEKFIPILQAISVAAEWDESSKGEDKRRALSEIGDRLGRLNPHA
jgi:DNA-binding XRE family transcriptional regulator